MIDYLQFEANLIDRPDNIITPKGGAGCSLATSPVRDLDAVNLTILPYLTIRSEFSNMWHNNSWQKGNINMVFKIVGVILVVLLSIFIFIGCRKQNKSESQKGTYVNFTSRLGNTMTCPDFWVANEMDQVWSVGDGQAKISVYTVTAEGSGTLNDFRDVVINNMGELKSLKSSGWNEVKNNNWNGVYSKFESENQNEGNTWQFMIVSTGKYYHAIMIKMPALVYSLNKDTYKNIAMTFVGRE